MGNKKVDVILYRTRGKKRATAACHNTANIRVKFTADLIRKKRFTVLRGENKMNKEGGKGLGHAVKI